MTGIEAFSGRYIKFSRLSVAHGQRTLGNGAERIAYCAGGIGSESVVDIACPAHDLGLSRLAFVKILTQLEPLEGTARFGQGDMMFGIDGAQYTADRWIRFGYGAAARYGPELVALFDCCATISGKHLGATLVDAILAGGNFLGTIDGIVRPKLVGRQNAHKRRRTVGILVNAGNLKSPVGADRGGTFILPYAHPSARATDFDQRPAVAVFIFSVVLPQDRVADTVGNQSRRIFLDNMGELMPLKNYFQPNWDDAYQTGWDQIVFGRRLQQDNELGSVVQDLRFDTRKADTTAKDVGIVARQEDRGVDPQDVEPGAVLAAGVFDGSDHHLPWAVATGQRPAADLHVPDKVGRILIAVQCIGRRLPSIAGTEPTCRVAHGSVSDAQR